MRKRAEEEALFTWVSGALRFALNYTHGTLKQPSLAQFLPKQKIGKGLGGLDGAAQAGMIQSQLDWLSQRRKHILVAKYLVPDAPCKCGQVCCVGYRENKDWAAAIDWLTEYVLVQGLTGTISYHRFRRALVRRYFGQRENFIELAARCRIERHLASEYYKQVYEHLKAEEKRAHWDFEGVLKDANIIE